MEGGREEGGKEEGGREEGKEGERREGGTRGKEGGSQFTRVLQENTGQHRQGFSCH